MLHEGPYKGKDHPHKNSGSIHPPSMKESSFRSSTHFVPGMSFPATDPLCTTHSPAQSECVIHVATCGRGLAHMLQSSVCRSSSAPAH